MPAISNILSFQVHLAKLDHQSFLIPLASLRFWFVCITKLHRTPTNGKRSSNERQKQRQTTRPRTAKKTANEAAANSKKTANESATNGKSNEAAKKTANEVATNGKKNANERQMNQAKNWQTKRKQIPKERRQNNKCPSSDWKFINSHMPKPYSKITANLFFEWCFFWGWLWMVVGLFLIWQCCGENPPFFWQSEFFAPFRNLTTLLVLLSRD